MKKLLFILFTICSFSAIAAPKSVHKKKSFEKQNLFDPVLQSITVGCGVGYAGYKTYWYVYESTTGQVVGQGSYGTCRPVNYA